MCGSAYIYLLKEWLMVNFIFIYLYIYFFAIRHCFLLKKVVTDAIYDHKKYQESEK